jgi:hypothetical protein
MPACQQKQQEEQHQIKNKQRLVKLSGRQV